MKAFLRTFSNNLITAVVSIVVFIAIQPTIFLKIELTLGEGTITSRNVATAITTLIISFTLLLLGKVKDLFTKGTIIVSTKRCSTFWEKKIEVDKNELLAKNDRSKFVLTVGLDNYNFIPAQIIKFLMWRGYRIYIRTYLSPISSDVFLAINNYVDCQSHYDSKGFEVEVTEKIKRLIKDKKKIENVQVIFFEMAFNQDYELFNNYINYDFKFDLIVKKVKYKELAENWFVKFMMYFLIKIKKDCVEIMYNSNKK